MSNNPALINLDGISDIAIKLLDMIEHLAGWVASPKGKAADFEEGLEFYKNSLEQDTSLTDREKAVKLSLARTEFRKYVNQAKIVSQAVDSLSRSINPSHIDDIDADWINTFLSYAVALALLIALVPGRLGKFLRLGLQQLVEGFFYTSTHKFLELALDYFLI